MTRRRPGPQPAADLGVAPDPVETPVLVADSFLVDDGRVRGLELHRARFASSCAAHGVSVDAFWADAIDRLPRGGRWFPRVELTLDGGLALRIRPAPRSGGAVRVAPYAGPDPRTAPLVKGPDLLELGRLKADAAASSGADEVLLMTGSGVVLEAAYSGVLWWEDDVLCVPPPDLPVLDSVTVRLLRGLAAARGVAVVPGPRTLAELDGCEVWLVSALHGIRPVRAWVGDRPAGLGPAAGTATRAPAWQQALRALSEALPRPRP